MQYRKKGVEAPELQFELVEHDILPTPPDLLSEMVGQEQTQRSSHLGYYEHDGK